jgi:hypothetical protein
MVSELSVADRMAFLFWAYGEAEIMGGACGGETCSPHAGQEAETEGGVSVPTASSRRKPNFLLWGPTS